jgi:threonine dehydratase
MITLEDIQAAATRIRSACVHTPLVRLPSTTGEWFLKAENLQETGAFKFRGATNAIRSLEPAQLASGVVTCSSGNHGRAVAMAAIVARTTATIVMPDQALAVKVAAIEALGAQIVRVPFDERLAAAKEISHQSGARFISAYEDPRVIAGQGTIGLEILEDMPDVSTVVVPVGGGGLVAGVAVALKALNPHVRVIAVEPANAGDLAESFRCGRRIRWPSERTRQTIADGLRTESVGSANWSLIRSHVDDVITVTEDEIAGAMRAIADHCHLVVEPSGAVAPAALIYGHVAAGARAVAIVSGGNVDLDSFLRIGGASQQGSVRPELGGGVTRDSPRGP